MCLYISVYTLLLVYPTFSLAAELPLARWDLKHERRKHAGVRRYTKYIYSIYKVYKVVYLFFSLCRNQNHIVSTRNNNGKKKEYIYIYNDRK